jgi:hypothetical protein
MMKGTGANSGQAANGGRLAGGEKGTSRHRPRGVGFN